MTTTGEGMAMFGSRTGPRLVQAGLDRPLRRMSVVTWGLIE